MEKSDSSTAYTNVKVPKPLAESVRAIAKKHGYRSLSEFAVDAIRRRLEDLSRNQIP